MKTVLVIISQGPLAGQRLLEALSATLVLATFGLDIKVCFKDEAIYLLNAPSDHSAVLPSFKSAYRMVESFEFYDLLPVLVVATSNSQINALQKSNLEYQQVILDNALLNQFDQVLYW